jgi:hypothetical protein
MPRTIELESHNYETIGVKNKVKLFVMKPAGFRYAETYYLSPSLPFNPLSYLVRFGSKTHLIPHYQIIFCVSVFRSLESFAMCRKSAKTGQWAYLN